MELLYRRVTLDFDSIPSGIRTAEAELGLGFEPSTYFYVERPHPHFGESVIAFDDETNDAANAVPFDSGGLWHGYVPLIVEANPDRKREIAHQWTIRCPDYQLTFADWVDREIGALTDYRSGVRPRNVLPPEIDLSTAGSQSWTWEGRLSKNAGGESSLSVLRVYLMDGRRSAYLAWLRDQRWLSRPERSEHLSWVAERVVETANPVDEMIIFLGTS